MQILFMAFWIEFFFLDGIIIKSMNSSSIPIDKSDKTAQNPNFS